MAVDRITMNTGVPVMRALVVFESMYGNTHAVAERIADGLRETFDAVGVVSVDEATADLVASADLVVVGGPTHVHQMSSARTRAAAVDAAEKVGSGLHIDPDAEGAGLRDWFDRLDSVDHTPAAAFDTRVDGPALITGRASRGIAQRLRRHHFRLLLTPESFLVDHENRLLADEDERARAWGRSLAKASLQAAAGADRDGANHGGRR
jgi:hypothetical protein